MAEELIPYCPHESSPEEVVINLRFLIRRLSVVQSELEYLIKAGSDDEVKMRHRRLWRYIENLLVEAEIHDLSKEPEWMNESSFDPGASNG